MDQGSLVFPLVKPGGESLGVRSRDKRSAIRFGDKGADDDDVVDLTVAH